MQRVFAEHGLPMPEIAAETRSITVLKSLVTRAGFLSWMAALMYDTESAAGVFDTLPIPGLVARRTLTAFRRRQGILPRPRSCCWTVTVVDRDRSMSAPIAPDTTDLFVCPGAPPLDKISTRFLQ